ncbi:unnamed protein product [Allacma fusca]|uniref:Uncharacterized protein n=1 Tax=Allacma fusca TaxID=39272 RepID=A0A8J2JGW3_9HEXA|nr:unnamed protein product [Allacma fusca]
MLAGEPNPVRTGLSNSIANSEELLALGSSGSEEIARAFFWISPYWNWNIFFVVICFALMPVTLLWLYIIYPPGKYYSNVPPPPQYVGWAKHNFTDHDSFFADLLR